MESFSSKCNNEEASIRISKTSLCRDSFIISIKAELTLTPKDLHLHETLLKRYLSINEVDKAFEHAYTVEFRDKIFHNDLNWYTILHEILLCDSAKNEGWLYQVLLLTVTERICSLYLSQKFEDIFPIIEICTFLHTYDQAIHKVISLGPSLGLEMFHTAMLEHHKGQIALHSATFLLIKDRNAENDTVVPKLMLMAWQTAPSNLKRNWLRHAPEKQVLAVNRWYIEGTYRCSQAGHYCLHLIKTLSLDTFRIYTRRKYHFNMTLFADIKRNASYFSSGDIGPHPDIIPSLFEVEAYDKDAQKEYSHSLHHMVWTLLKYEKVADFECTLFDMLNFSSMDSEIALNKLDIYAFLYCVMFTARNNENDISILPANINSILCSTLQAEWWERAYEYTNKVGSELTEIDATFSYGIKVIRCMGNKKLDPELLYNLGCIFSERAEMSTDIKETHQLKERASLYYYTALLFLRKLIDTSVENVTQYRDITMFNYVCKDMDNIKMNHLLKECKTGLIKNSLTYGEYQAFYNLACTYKRNALIFNDRKSKDKVITSLLEAKTFSLKALKVLEQESNIHYVLNSEIQELIHEINIDLKNFEINSTDFKNAKYSENESIPSTNYNFYTDANLSCFEEYYKLMKHIIASHVNLLDSARNQVNDKIDKYKSVTEDIQCLKRKITELEARIFKNSSLGPIYIGLPLPGSSTTSTMPQFGLDRTVQNVATSNGKSVFGGFTFSSTPTLKPVLHDEESAVKKPLEMVTNKMNVFSGIPFINNTSSPSSNIFIIKPTNKSTLNNKTQNIAQNTSALDKLNSSETIEEYESNEDFKPVIPLPPLIDQKTGEEDENILFEHRAKLLRFHAASKEWKERGLGNIKLLVHKNNIQKVRLLMRREQIMKVCCNHSLTKEMIFQKMPNVDKAVIWCAKDFSEGELVAETLCLRFKTALLCDQFIEVVKAAQTKMKDKSKLAKEEQNATKQTAQTGFRDKFKFKSGLWHCDTCYTNNLMDFNKCACCQTSKPKSKTFAPTNVTITTGWGDKFKPKADTWECQSCLVRNESTFETCTVCNSPKDPTKMRTLLPSMSQLDNTTKFNFGIPQSTVNSTVAVKTKCTGSVLFKLNPFEHKKSIFDTTPTGAVQFKFGMPPTINDQKPNEKVYRVNGTDTHKFSFGIPSNNYNNSEASAALGEKSYDMFDTQKTATDSAPVDCAEPALLSAPHTDSATSFVIKEDRKFNYVFKPKMGKSSVKSTLKDRDNENDDSEYVAEDEYRHSFTPAIPLPDKVEVVTGEENEIELYGHLAKLYRFISSEWKERGKGIVKILKHEDTGKLRVVMRRDQVLKICLNHLLSSELNYTAKDEKTWLFSVHDFSEGELTLEHFCLRFKNKEIASQFKEAVDKAMHGGSLNNKLTKDDSDDVIFMNEIQATKQERRRQN